VTGKYTRIVVPLPFSLSTSIQPPCFSTNRLQIASPNPLPEVLVV
jgi:hypothetical protein